MNFFAAVKQSLFATKLFAAINFNFEDAFKANNENALKAHLDSAIAAAKPTGENAEHTRLITEAVTENTRLAGELATVKAALEQANIAISGHVTRHASIVSTVTACGVNVAECNDAGGAFSPDKFKAAHKLTIATAARTELARHGISQPLPEAIEADPTKKNAATAAMLTFAEFNALSQPERISFSRRDGKISG